MKKKKKVGRMKKQTSGAYQAVGQKMSYVLSSSNQVSAVCFTGVCEWRLLKVTYVQKWTILAELL